MIEITPISAFKDNYIWAITNPNNPQVVVVDPGDAAPIIEYLCVNNLQLNAILLTHHHDDHIGGVEALLQHTIVPVYGPQSTLIRSVTKPLTEGSSIDLIQGLQLKVMEIPAHTLDHIAYYNEQVLFCGDTLFTAGAGRIFEGTAKQMLQALQRLAALNPQTQVYCGHEYTLNNLRFAAMVEPGNLEIQKRLAEAQQLREKNKPTVPSTIGLELQTNPFLRSKIGAVVSSVEAHFRETFSTPVEVLAALREWKNNTGT